MTTSSRCKIYVVSYFQIDQLSLVPEESQKAIDTMQKKLEKLEEDKNGEEEKLKVVMDSLKTETQVHVKSCEHED